MINEFENRRNFMVEELSKLNKVLIIRFNGVFYIMVNIFVYLNIEFNG